MKTVTKKIFKRDGNYFLPIELLSDGSKTTLELLVDKNFKKELINVEKFKADERDLVIKQIVKSIS